MKPARNYELVSYVFPEDFDVPERRPAVVDRFFPPCLERASDGRLEQWFSADLRRYAEIATH